MDAAGFEMDLSLQETDACLSGWFPASRCRISTPQAGPDVHLMMNTFNRMLGGAAFADWSASEQVFDLSDYLRLCIVYSRPVEVRLQDEIALLRSYLRLAAGFRGWVLDVPMTISPGLADRRLPAHSICRLAQAVLNAYGMETPGHWTMSIHLCLLRDHTLEIAIALRPLSAQPAPRFRRVERELEELCTALSPAGKLWHHHAVCPGHGEIRITVNVC